MSNTFPRGQYLLRGHRLKLFVLACVLYYVGRAPFLGQWDSFDYLKQTVTHQLSDLGFGRPFFIGYNILLWESARRVFRLSPPDVEWVVMAGIIAVGALGVLLFERFTRQLLPPEASRMAVVALLVSPMYALYSGFIMTEVPMTVVMIATASILWASGKRSWGALAGGALFGVSVGIREQAVTMGAACLWILWARRESLRLRLQGWILFSLSALTVILAPIVILYLHDTAWFLQRTRIWLQTIPMGEVHFWKNFEATLLFALAVCPGAWLALACGGIYRGCRRGRPPSSGSSCSVAGESLLSGQDAVFRVPHPIWGVFCAIILPMAALCGDADVQIHPRYAMVVLPGFLISCVALYHRLLPGRKAAVAWAILQVLVFGVAQFGIQPLRQIQRQKKEYADLVLHSVPEGGLLIPGGYSPILDYYRGIGVRPDWRLLWSGWGWDRREAEARIHESWSRHQPVYLLHGPYGWLYFEDEWLDLYFMLKGCRKEEIAPGIVRISPP